MKSGSLQSTAAIVSLALIASGCQSLTPGQNAAVFGGLGAVAAGGIAKAAGMSTGGAIATGAAVGAAVAVTIFIIAKHQATERQRQLAEEHASHYFSNLSPEKKTALKKKRVRYIAVDTEKNARTSPKAEKAVMIWDTESHQVVGSNVYDVESTPALGSTAKFDTYSAEYVSTGA